jgi:hypothetical protein
MPSRVRFLWGTIRTSAPDYFDNCVESFLAPIPTAKPKTAPSNATEASVHPSSESSSAPGIALGVVFGTLGGLAWVLFG